MIKVPSIVQIILAEMLMVWGLSAFVMGFGTRSGPAQCKNNQNIDFATVLADLGAGGDVLIVGNKYDRSGFDELVSKANGNKGKQIEVMGKLRKMPSVRLIEKWKAYCELDKLPPTPAGGRWVLEMRQP